MNAVPGYNPLRWRCTERGCYNIKMRPKIEVFAECLPGKLAFTDIDGTAEVNGHFLFLEFKSGTEFLPTGQRIYLQRLTALSPKIMAVVVNADSETMETKSYCCVSGGKVHEWLPCSLTELRAKIAKWAKKAKAAA